MGIESFYLFPTLFSVPRTSSNTPPLIETFSRTALGLLKILGSLFSFQKLISLQFYKTCLQKVVLLEKNVYLFVIANNGSAYNEDEIVNIFI